jgi:predicted aminopeptidase
MDTELNNAKLASLAAYHDEVAHFLALLARCDADFTRFYAVVEALGQLKTTQRSHCLHILGSAQVPAAECAVLLR